MDPTSAVVVLCLFLLIGLGAYILPKEKPRRPPDHIHEVYDRD